jgi:hypothetical protein
LINPAAARAASCRLNGSSQVTSALSASSVPGAFAVGTIATYRSPRKPDCSIMNRASPWMMYGLKILRKIVTLLPSGDSVTSVTLPTCTPDMRT